LSNKRKLKKAPLGSVHLDNGPATCGECGRELHDLLGVTEGMLEYKCECNCRSFVTPVLETTSSDLGGLSDGLGWELFPDEDNL